MKRQVKSSLLRMFGEFNLSGAKEHDSGDPIAMKQNQHSSQFTTRVCLRLTLTFFQHTTPFLFFTFCCGIAKVSILDRV